MANWEETAAPRESEASLSLPDSLPDIDELIFGTDSTQRHSER